MKFNYEIFLEGELYESHTIKTLYNEVLSTENEIWEVDLKMPDEPGKYYLKFVLQSDWYPPFINSGFIRLEVE